MTFGFFTSNLPEVFNEFFTYYRDIPMSNVTRIEFIFTSEFKRVTGAGRHFFYINHNIHIPAKIFAATSARSQTSMMIHDTG